jgi:uncharacterized protein (TIGR02271 family)
MAEEHTNEPAAMMNPDADGDREIVVPLLSEEMSVSKRVVPTGRVQVSRITREREELVDELLTSEHVEIERKPMNKPVDAIPSMREEGDTVIIPIVEEVIERRLVLKEEVSIRRVRQAERHQERVTLRRQEAVVTRSSVQDSAVSGDG